MQVRTSGLRPPRSAHKLKQTNSSAVHLWDERDPTLIRRKLQRSLCVARVHQQPRHSQSCAIWALLSWLLHYYYRGMCFIRAPLAFRADIFLAWHTHDTLFIAALRCFQTHHFPGLALLGFWAQMFASVLTRCKFSRSILNNVTYLRRKHTLLSRTTKTTSFVTMNGRQLSCRLLLMDSGSLDILPVQNQTKYSVKPSADSDRSKWTRSENTW